jgi:hypothetical protein
MALGSTQPLTDRSTRNVLGVKGGRRVGLMTSPSVSRLSRKCGNLYSYGSSWPVTRKALPLYKFFNNPDYYYNILRTVINRAITFHILLGLVCGYERSMACFTVPFYFSRYLFYASSVSELFF